jgi:hypothetical protein
MRVRTKRIRYRWRWNRARCMRPSSLEIRRDCSRLLARCTVRILRASIPGWARELICRKGRRLRKPLVKRKMCQWAWTAAGMRRHGWQGKVGPNRRGVRTRVLRALRHQERGRNRAARIQHLRNPRAVRLPVRPLGRTLQRSGTNRLRRSLRIQVESNQRRRGKLIRTRDQNRHRRVTRLRVNPQETSIVLNCGGVSRRRLRLRTTT